MPNATTPRPLSPRELVAFERLVQHDTRAAIALCFRDASKPEDLARGDAAMAAADAAWLAREVVSCGKQVAA